MSKISWGIKRYEDYADHAEETLLHFQKLGCNMNIKGHFLHSHIDRVPEIRGGQSSEQREYFDQDFLTMEERFQCRWYKHMKEDYCWSFRVVVAQL